MDGHVDEAHGRDRVRGDSVEEHARPVIGIGKRDQPAQDGRLARAGAAGDDPRLAVAPPGS